MAVVVRLVLVVVVCQWVRCRRELIPAVVCCVVLDQTKEKYHHQKNLYIIFQQKTRKFHFEMVKYVFFI